MKRQIERLLTILLLSTCLVYGLLFDLPRKLKGASMWEVLVAIVAIALICFVCIWMWRIATKEESEF